jgi:phage gpG-like protein
MASGGGLSGQWGRVRQILTQGLKRAKPVAIKQAAAYFEGQVKKNLTSGGRLAGKPFRPLAASTLRRRRKGKGAGRPTPLVDTGDMRNSVHPVVLDDHTAFVGIRRGEIGRAGQNLLDIAQVHEFGTVSTKAIPARPFLRPVVHKFAQAAGQVYARALKREFEGGGPAGGLAAGVGALIRG